MHIFVNGQSYHLATAFNLAELIQQLELHGQRIAVEVNQAVIPRSQFPFYQLHPGDRVEIIHAVGGG